MDLIFLIPIIAAVLLLLLRVRIVIYRLYAHPLSGFPGPRLAAATFFYEFYYDVIKKGMYIWEIERMHEKYGMYFCLFISPSPHKTRKTLGKRHHQASSSLTTPRPHRPY